jgi:hypothetical protein
MFTRDDFTKYFIQVSDIEQKMRENIEALLGVIKEKSVVASLKRIKKDEIKHLRILKEIGKILDESGGERQ